MVTADNQGDDVAVAAVDQQRLDAARRIHAQLRGELGDGACVRGGYLGQRFCGRRARRAGRDGGRHLQIGGVIIGIGEDDGVLSGVREDVEFLGCGAADCCRCPPARRETQGPCA